MGSLFSPKVTTPAPEKPKALPQEDDEQTRRAKLKQYAKLAESSGRESTRLSGGESRLGDYQPAATRGAVLTG